MKSTLEFKTISGKVNGRHLDESMSASRAFVRTSASDNRCESNMERTTPTSHNSSKFTLINGSRRTNQPILSTGKGYQYYYNANCRKNFTVKIDEFLTKSRVGGFSQSSLFENEDEKCIISEMMKEYKKIFAIWKEYEHNWHLFEQGSKEIPWPPNPESLLAHFAYKLYPEILNQQNPINSIDWKKVLKQAIIRYHPDKFEQNFSKFLTTDEERQYAKKRTNEITQILNECYRMYCK